MAYRAVFVLATDVINRVFNTHALVRIGGVAKKGYFCEIIGQKR